MEVNIAPLVKCRTRRTRGRIVESGTGLEEVIDTRELPAVLAFMAARERWRNRLAGKDRPGQSPVRSGLMCELDLFEELEDGGWKVEVPATMSPGAILHAPSQLTGPDYSLAIVVDPGFLNC